MNALRAFIEENKKEITGLGIGVFMLTPAAAAACDDNCSLPPASDNHFYYHLKTSATPPSQNQTVKPTKRHMEGTKSHLNNEPETFDGMDCPGSKSFYFWVTPEGNEGMVCEKKGPTIIDGLFTTGQVRKNIHVRAKPDEGEVLFVKCGENANPCDCYRLPWQKCVNGDTLVVYLIQGGPSRPVCISADGSTATKPVPAEP